MVSRITLTMMIRDVPMKDILFTENSPEIIIGITLITIRPAAPTRII